MSGASVRTKRSQEEAVQDELARVHHHCLHVGGSEESWCDTHGELANCPWWRDDGECD